MSDHINDLATKVVDAFRKKLSNTSKAALTTQELDYLQALVKEALNKHAAAIAEELGQVMNKLKGEIDKPEIGL